MKLDHRLESCTLGGSFYRDIAAGIKRRVEEGNNTGPESKLKKPSSSLPFGAKMVSFVEEIESVCFRGKLCSCIGGSK